jgi:hypothetical protein
MPVKMKYIDDGNGIEMMGTGVVTGDEIHNAFNEYYSGDMLLKTKYLIANFLDAEQFNVSNEDVGRIAAQEIQASKTGLKRLIALVGKQDVIFGLLRMWEGHTFRSGFETMVFRDREEALTWISQKIAGRE